ncbi:hypothetical protein K5M33_16325 [Chromobacterium vaccinii]|nr:hypothetical protein [Chromobacterium vaccinii]MBX9358288.1 hypothetical protein [Chromobacterium vaccinii]
MSGTFFILTAKHVVQSAVGANQQNESPFFFIKDWCGSWGDAGCILHERVLYPKLLWDIGEIAVNDGLYVNYEDVVLIELYPPVGGRPDYYIDFDKVNYLRGNEYFEGQHLNISGYPFIENSFEYGFEDESMPWADHMTTVSRHHLMGHCQIDRLNKEYRISYDLSHGWPTHERLDGFSGGVVTNQTEKRKTVRWAGMCVLVRESVRAMYFMPAHRLVPLVMSYRDAPMRVIDPMAELEVHGRVPSGYECVVEVALREIFARYRVTD